MRLTKRDKAGNARKNCEDCEIKFRESCCSKQLCLNALISKLAAYEDTGLEPEAIDGLRLSLCGAISMSIAEEQGYVEVNRAQEIAHAEAEGRLVVLPCKVGDMVYYLTGNPTLASGYHFNRVESTKCIGFYWDREGLQICLYMPHGNHGTYGRYGKTIFLTREDAEAALNGGQHGV